MLRTNVVLKNLYLDSQSPRPHRQKFTFAQQIQVKLTLKMRRYIDDGNSK